MFASLGGKLTKALRDVSKAIVVDEKVIDGCLNAISMALLQADVNIRLVKKLQTNVKLEYTKLVQHSRNKEKILYGLVARELHLLLGGVKSCVEPTKGKENRIMFVGLQGSGKTTSLTKCAYYYQKRGWRVAVIAADTYRAGAFDQLKQNASKISVPFYGSYTERDPVEVVKQGLERFRGYEIIFIDTAGRHAQALELFEEMKSLAQEAQPQEIVLVVDSMIGQIVLEQATAFAESVNVGSIILTKCDGHAKGGGALTAVASTRCPIRFVGTGEHVQDLMTFDATSFVNRLLGKGDLKQFAEIVSQAAVPQSLVKDQKWTFRTLYEFIPELTKLPLNQLFEMLPAQLRPRNKNQKQPEPHPIDAEILKRWKVIMDSMTRKELDSTDPKGLTPPRMQRIALGSGTPLEYVRDFLSKFKMLEPVINKLLKNPHPEKMLKTLGFSQSGMPDMSEIAKLVKKGNLGQLTQQLGQLGLGGLGGLARKGARRRR